jgi:hypothetical protein
LFVGWYVFIYGHLPVEWSVVRLDFVPSFVLSGELPASIIKMKTDGVRIIMGGNIRLTLPLDIGALGDIRRLNLSFCLLEGSFIYGHLPVE